MKPFRARRLGRKGIDLSINTLVVIILGMLILGGGFLLLSQIDSSTRDLLQDVGRTTQQKIDKELVGGNLISIPDNTRTNAKYGIQHFALGFVNKLTETHIFKPEFEFREAFTSNGTSITIDGDEMLFHRDFDDSTNYVTLAANEVVKDIAFSITIPHGSPKGTYVFDVTIFYDKTIHNPPNDIYAQKQVRITLD